VAELAPPHIARRIPPSLRGIAEGRAIYLEDGQQPAFGSPDTIQGQAHPGTVPPRDSSPPDG
jgi:hypothetical protein